ncbi:non-specific serine/threonine protein kinase [Kitasatospora gansuensis]|uniref:Non-specific serine/threonine protein kinase n=1 Tax=Kitasatospora gansuensis TaxID=258050 RepID=A0A7W7WIL3_9ACTN|nr:DEAD/DEAH box helicase [Kitasatospora gansuensis]MBB4948376.1 non-specific serine/threonine protein kinase [Kitasatospora gansuensis]
MYALHALWRADGALALWAEDARAYTAARLHRPGGAPVAATAHPFAAPAAEVARLLAALGPGPGWLAEQAPERWSTLRLPSLSGAPTPSPQLPIGATGRGVSLTAWRVPVLLFPQAEAAQLLGELFDPYWSGASLELPGVEGSVELAYGASLRWLTAVHDLAWRLAGRGRALPVLRERDGIPYATWQPAPERADRREADALVRGCPPAVLAEGRTGAAELVAELLDRFVDQEIRTALDGAAPGGDGASVAWWAALHRADGRFEAPAAELAELREQLAVWLAGSPPTDSPVRLCFRLSEPLGPSDSDPEGRPNDDDWQLDFLIQAVDQPSLLIPAAELWDGGPAFAALARQLADPVESYLAELDRAALRRPELRPGRGRRPTGLRLDRAGALDFLRSAAPALTEAGFGVLLPAWWQRRPGLGLALTATRTAPPGTVERAAQVDRDAVVDFRWQAAIGEVKLTQQELTDLGAAQQGLVRLRGRWVEVDAGQIAAALGFLTRHGTGSLPTAELLRLALDPTATAGGLPITEVTATGPLGELLAGRTQDTAAPALPPDFGATLRPYQERGLAWLHGLARLGLGGVLADDMGLGKTVQTLALLAAEQHAGAATGPTLLVCPMSLVGNWQREAARFAPMLRVHVHHGSERGSAIPPADLVITTYGVLQRDARALAGTQWRRVVADEAQYVKNSATAQSRALRSLPVTVHRIALTGTPVENRLAELHAILDFANPGLFGSTESFRERFAVPVEQHGSADAGSQLRRLSGPFVLRRLKTDPVIAAELPAKQEITVWCNLTAEQAGLYQAVVADVLHREQGIRGVERKATVLAAIGKLKQVCNHPAQLLHDRSPLGDRSGKVARLEELLTEALAEGDRVLVFTQYAEFGRLLQPHLTERLGEEVLYLHGGVPKHRREELVTRFQAPDGPRVFLLSLRAGGTGLNLTAANQVIHLDRWWNPAVEDQATDRAFRIGQRRDVQVRRLVCVGTVEERIAELIEAKRALAEAAVSTEEQWLTGLDPSTLRELVTLSADAIGAV